MSRSQVDSHTHVHYMFFLQKVQLILQGHPEPMADRIVITGAGGQVGRYLSAEAGRKGLDALALTSAEWDITDAGAAVTPDAERH